jgi:hypothetical protein
LGGEGIVGLVAWDRLVAKGSVIGPIVRSTSVAPERTVAPEGRVRAATAADPQPVTTRPSDTTAPESVLAADGTAFPADESSLHLLDEVDDEFQWTFHERRGWLVGIAVNLLVAGIWVGYTHYRPHTHDDFRIAGIATGVATFVLADVINTNQLGSDADRVAHNLEGGHGVVHELALKNAALALLLLPLTVFVSVGVRVALDRWRAIPHAVVLDIGVVVLWMAMGNVLSVLLPYRPIDLRERWRLPRTWPRWALCLAIPYGAYYAHRWLVWPVDRIDHHRLLGSTDRNFMAYCLVATGWSIIVWLISLAFVWWYSHVARNRLDRDLHRSD